MFSLIADTLFEKKLQKNANPPALWTAERKHTIYFLGLIKKMVHITRLIFI